MRSLAVRLALLASLVLASSPSFASPTRVAGGWQPTVVAAPDAIDDAAIAERVARRYLADHLATLAPGSQASDFELVTDQLDGDVRTVVFTQRWRGVPVVGGKLGFVFAHDQLFAVRAGAWPHVQTALPIMRALRGTRAILPIALRGVTTYHDVDVVETATTRDYIAIDGRTLLHESRVMDATSTLQYNAGVRYATGVRQDFAAPNATLLVNSVATTTSATGVFSWTGTSNASAQIGVAGPYVRVLNAAGPTVTATMTAMPGQPLVWNTATDELVDAQLSTFIYATQGKAHARIVNAALATWLDQQLDFYVNEDGACNASATGDEVHLHRGDAGCENTGRLADVVYHELGHCVHKHSIITGMGAFETNLSEGLADFFAADITDDPGVGRGIRFDDSPLRDIDPLGTERMYPLDFDFDPHISGLIISGALWDLRKALIKQLGNAAGIARTQKVLTGIMQRADDISTTFTAALIADDDDGNLANYTPNYCAIERAFGAHGLVPDYVTTHVSPPVVSGLDISIAVDTPATAMCEPPVVVAIEVTWHPDDGVASTFELTPQGASWTGSFPEVPDGTVISYAVDVVFDDGDVEVFPNNPADPRYQLFIGTAVPIYCQSFDTDPFTGDRAWAQATNAGFEWQWGPPVIGLAAGDPAAAYTGTNVLGTDLSADGKYRPDLVVSVTTPVIDVSRFERVHLQYERWLTVEDANYDHATISVNNTEVWHNAKSANGTLDHVDREWRFQDVDITSAISDGAVQITWGLTSDFGKELGGWTLDDVCINGLVKIPRCGDGEIDFGEECDDGNNTDGDGCAKDCNDEVEAGGGGCCDARGAAPGNGLLALALAGVLRACSRRRGRSCRR